MTTTSKGDHYKWEFDHVDKSIASSGYSSCKVDGNLVL